MVKTSASSAGAVSLIPGQGGKILHTSQPKNQNRKLTFSSPMATAEFSKFAGLLSAALSQHQLSLLYCFLHFFFHRI